MQKKRSGHLDILTMRSIPVKSKLNRGAVKGQAGAVPALRRRLQSASH
jgi:hypothetical protein